MKKTFPPFVFLLIFLLGTGTILLAKKYLPYSEKNPAGEEITARPQLEALPQLPSGWQRYISPAKTFSIGYPGDKQVVIEENRPSIPVCGLEMADVFFRIYDLSYPYLKEPEFGGDLMLSIIALNNEEYISLRDWIEAYCPEDWVGQNLADLESTQGQAVRSYNLGLGKEILVGHNCGGRIYFLYAFSNKTDETPETLLAEMLNTFQVPR